VATSHKDENVSTATHADCTVAAKPLTKALALLGNLSAVVVFCPHFFSWAGVVFFALLTFGTLNLFLPQRKDEQRRNAVAAIPPVTCMQSNRN